ncbi:MAG: hypothetical protein Q7T55_22910 [Solirubrobacteraceae bacterium]|nr:hypothetical protein [Solirubrobacteraceae bacterium]
MSDSSGHAEARLDSLLATFAAQLGRDAEGYGNHVRRVFGLVRAQGPHLSADELQQVAVAAVFHDLGIWTDDTFDYLAPSRARADTYLHDEGRTDWIPVVNAMIMEHHKLRPVRDASLVEAFRRADLCDVSLGLMQRGIPAGEYAHLRAKHPIAGFHLRLVQFAGGQVRKHPLRPLPMLRW